MDIKVIVDGRELDKHILDCFCDGTSFDLLDDVSILDEDLSVSCRGNYQFVIQYVPYEKADCFSQEDIEGILYDCKAYTWRYTHNTHVITIDEVVNEEYECYQTYQDSY